MTKYKEINDYVGYADIDAMKKYGIKITKTGRGDPHWVIGTIKGRKFEAKVYNEPSDFGLYNGRISKLFIARDKSLGLSNTIYQYDRGSGPSTQEGKRLARQFLKVFPKSVY